MKRKFLNFNQKYLNIFTNIRFLIILSCVVFGYLLNPIYAQKNRQAKDRTPVYAQKNQQAKVNFDVNVENNWSEIEIKLDGKFTNEKKKITITRKSANYRPANTDEIDKLPNREKIKLSNLVYLDDEIKVEYDEWSNAEDAFISIDRDASNPKLKIQDLPLPSDNYKFRASISLYGENTDLPEKNYEIVNGSNNTINISTPSFWAELKEKYGTNENILITIILGLIGILTAVSKKKIEAGINWVLDKLGQYSSGKLADRRFTRLYLDIVSAEHKYLKLIGSTTPGMNRPLLEEVFVSLRISGFTQEHNNLGENSGKPENKSEQKSFVSFADAISQYNKMVILGGPGAGKTTTLSHSLLVFSQKKAKEKFGIEKDLLPVFIPLRRLSGKGKSILEDLTSKESQILPADLLKDCPVGYFEKRLKNGRCIVLLDGLDEVVDEKTHREIAQSINTLVSTYPDNYFIVTCRIAGWQSLLSGDFKVLQTQDFSREEIQRFVLGWHRAVITQTKYTQFEIENKDKIKEKEKFEQLWAEHNQKNVKPAIERVSKTLLTAIEANNRILAIAVNPMLLSLICLIHYHKHILPRGRTILYKQCIELLIDEWDRQRDIVLHEHDVITPIQKETVLREIAFNFQTKGIGEDSRADLEDFINETAKRLGIGIPGNELLEEIELRSSLLTERSIDVFGFSHLTLQEYLVAKHIQLNPLHRNLLYPNFDKQEWREVTLLYAGLLDDATDLVSRIMADDVSGRDVLAGYCIGDSQNCDDSVSQTVIERLLKRLDSKQENKEELIDVLSAIAADYAENASNVRQKLSEKLIKGIEQDKINDTESDYICNWIKILGKARITKSIKILIELLAHQSEAVRKQSAISLAEMGNSALPVMRNYLENYPMQLSSEFLHHDENLMRLFEEISDGKESVEQNDISKKENLLVDSYILDYSAEIRLLSFIKIAFEINSGESAKFLTEFYQIFSNLNRIISLVLSRMLKNPFVEEELIHLKKDVHTQGFHFVYLDGNGWYAHNLPINSVFNHLVEKIRNDILLLVIESKDTVSTTSSFKILFPAVVQVIRYYGNFYDEKTKEYFLESVGFSSSEENQLDFLSRQIKKNKSMTIEYALSRGGADTDDNISSGKNKADWGSVVGNILFLILTLLIFIFEVFAVYVVLNQLQRDFLTAIWFFLPPILFVMILATLSYLKLNKEFTIKEILASVLFSFQNFHKIMPYFTKQKLWLKFLILHFIAFFCSPMSIYLIKNLYTYFYYSKEIYWDPTTILLFLSPNLVFLTGSFIYLKFYVLKQNPIYQLILLHPEGKKLLGKRQ